MQLIMANIYDVCLYVERNTPADFVFRADVSGEQLVVLAQTPCPNLGVVFSSSVTP